MKKTLKGIIVALAFMLPCGVFADDAPTPKVPSSADTPTPGDGLGQNQNAPIAPATLLLLGLGGATAGTVVYRNIKKEEK